MVQPRYGCWTSGLLVALLALTRTRAPASAFVLTAPRSSELPQTTPSLPGRAAGLCAFRPPAGAWLFSRRFLEDGESRRDFSAALRLVMHEGGDLTMGCRDSGEQRGRRRRGRTHSWGGGGRPDPVSVPRALRENASGGGCTGSLNGRQRGGASESPVAGPLPFAARDGGEEGARAVTLLTAFRWRHRARRTLARVNGGRDYGEINGSGGAANATSNSNGSGDGSGEVGGGSRGSPAGGAAVEELRRGTPDAVDAEQSAAAAAAKAQLEEKLAGITDPLDYVYAVMPHIQEILKETTGWEGIGAGYEDARVGFYRDSNLKPLNWRDAMVSMKPGSGTIGIDPDLDDYAGTPADVERRRLRRSGMMKRRMAEAEGARKPPGVAPPSPEMPRTRYGGPPPGTHGPWRWGQLVKGSALERRLKAEIASFPRRLPRRRRRYFDDKVVWITGADHGLGEQLAINLTVNGARVILSGMDLHELERVQRLCILAWMKAVDWEIFKACYDGLTRLDRVMILPLDVRDDLVLDDARIEAESMLDRPVDMVFHCQTGGGDGDDGGRGDDDEGQQAAPETSDPSLQAMEASLRGAIALTKVLLPTMLDRQEGHVVVFGDHAPFSPTPKDRLPSAGDVASQQSAQSYFDGLRAEVARDRIKITIMHRSHYPLHRSGRHASGQPSPQSAGGNEAPTGGSTSAATTAPHSPSAKETGIAARRVLAQVARGQPEVSLHVKILFGAARLGVRVLALGEAVRGSFIART